MKLYVWIGYKVKGLLMHLEQTSASLQQQLMEDKLRLRQESERCAGNRLSGINLLRYIRSIIDEYI